MLSLLIKYVVVAWPCWPLLHQNNTYSQPGQDSKNATETKFKNKNYFIHDPDFVKYKQLAIKYIFLEIKAILKYAVGDAIGQKKVFDSFTR